jgi:hypothetical protein
MTSELPDLTKDEQMTLREILLKQLPMLVLKGKVGRFVL